MPSRPAHQGLRPRGGGGVAGAISTGSIAINVSDKLDAEVKLSTSHQFSTDYSLAVEHRDSEEPNKVATAVVGTPKSGKDKAQVVLESLVGEVRLLRKGVFVDPE